jgi:hypothetical protein
MNLKKDIDRKGERFMEMREKLMELHSKGYNCGQIICAVLGEELGWDESTPEALADMCESCGQICGTLRGGDFCINKFVREKTAREAGIPVEKVYDELSPEAQMKMMMAAKDMSGKLYDEFEKNNGGLLCRDLRGDMMLTCAKYVTDVIGILDGFFTEPE